MRFFIIALFCVLEYLGTLYLDGSHFLLYTVFCLLNTLIVCHFSKGDLTDKLIYIYVFTSWLIYNSLGFIHYELVVGIPQKIDTIYFLFIVATILLYLPSLFIKKKGTPIKLITEINLNKKTILILIGMSLFFKIFKIVLAGGWYNYVYAAYGTKVESGYMTFFHLFEGIFGLVTCFIYPFIFSSRQKWFRILLISYWLFTILLGAVSGSSLSVLSPLISLFVYAYFQTKDYWKRKFYKNCLYVSMGIGIIAGILIRVNRTDNSDFQMVNFKEAFDDIMISPTFDNMVNLEWVISDLNPTYTCGQLIYPFVHFLPRAIFPWKPMDLGAIVGIKFVGTTAEARVGFIPSALGNFYYDFGYIGIILGLLFVGCVVAKLQNGFNASYRSSDNPFILPLLLSVAGNFTMLPAWYTGSFNGLVNLFFYILIVKCISVVFSRKRKNRYRL